MIFDKMPSLKKSILWLASFAIFTHAMPIPESQVEFEVDDYDDLLAVENQIDKSIIAIAPPPKGFGGERLVSIAAAPKDFGGERLTSGTKETNEVASSHGTYSFSFETEDGMKRTEAGKHMASGGMVQTGSWEYVGPDGNVYKVEYIADENGFRPTGDHLPTTPALPPALQRFEDAKNGRQLSRGVASAAVLDTRHSREFAEFVQPMLIEFGPRSPKRHIQRYPYYY